MKSFETIRTWLIIGGLLLFSGVASLVWVSFSGQEGIAGPDLGAGLSLDNLAIDPGEPITIQLDQYLLGEVLVEAPLLRNLQGEEVSPLVLAAILAAVTVGGLLAVGVPLAFIYAMLDRQTVQVREDDAFQEQQAALAKKETERLRAVNEAKPATGTPNHEMPRWAKASTAMIIVFFAVMISYALGDTFYPDGDVSLGANLFVDPAVVISAVLGLIALISLAGTLGRGAGDDDADADRSRVPWGAIWVAITGFVFLGVGIGLMLAIRSAGG